MERISITYDIKFTLDFTPNYVWIRLGQCYNRKTGRFVKQTRCGGSIGYVIDGKFMSCTSLKPHLVKQK